MGASLSRLSSTAGAKEDDVTKPPPTPVIEPPYNGPWAEYQFVDVTVPVESDVTFSFTDAKMTSTLSSSVLPELTAMYRQGYGLASFCRLPTHATSTKRLFQPGAHVGYQAIFCRYEGDPGNEGWALSTEKSLLHMDRVPPGVLAKDIHPGAQHVQQVICSNVCTGGRLLALQWSGQQQGAGSGPVYGVDVVMEVPDQTLPERSVYRMNAAPATLLRRSLLTPRRYVTCDWTAVLTRHLARGWRLVDVFCELPVSATGRTLWWPASGQELHTVWLFEKPESRAKDDTPVYEGNIVEHWVDVTTSSSSSSLTSCRGSGCLWRGGRGGDGKRRGWPLGKGGKSGRNAASVKRKGGDPRHERQDAPRTDDVKLGKDNSENESAKSDKNLGVSNTEAAGPKEASGSCLNPTQRTSLSQSDTVGWEGTIRSLGEKGWELASVINTMDFQVVSRRSKVKVLLVFQRRISLTLCSKGRRTSDSLSLRTDDAAVTTAALTDTQLLGGDTSSHLNPSLAVRLPLSRSVSREHDDFTASCDDDVPSHVGACCSIAQPGTNVCQRGRDRDVDRDRDTGHDGNRESDRDSGLEQGLKEVTSGGLDVTSSVTSLGSQVTAAMVHNSTACHLGARHAGKGDYTSARHTSHKTEGKGDQDNDRQQGKGYFTSDRQEGDGSQNDRQEGKGDHSSSRLEETGNHANAKHEELDDHNSDTHHQSSA